MKKPAEGGWPLILMAVLLLAALAYFSFLGGMPLSDRDEGEYASAVAAMMKSGDYAVPTLNGRNYLEKPILIYWLMAAGQTVAGPDEEGVRLPSAISGFLLVFLVAGLVWRVSGSPQFAALAAAAAAFTPLSLLVGRAALTDMVLTFFTTISLGAFFVATERPGLSGRWWFLAAWAALGLGFLTKGPVAPAVVFPSALIYAAWRGGFWSIVKRAQIHWGILIFLAVNLPWYGLAFYRLGEEFWRAFFLAQNVRRFSEVLLGHGGGLFYYLPVFLLGFFPISAAGIPALFRALFKNRAHTRAYDPVARLRLFSGIIVAVVFVVFSLAATKQPNYIIPAMPFFAVLAGYHLWRLMAGETQGRAASWVFKGAVLLLGLIWLVVLAAVPVALPAFWGKILASIRPDSSEYALTAKAPVLILWPWLTALVATALVLCTLLWERMGRAGWQATALLVGGALFSGLLIGGFLGHAADIIQEPAKQMALKVKRAAAPDSRVASYGLWKPSLIYYLGRNLPTFRVAQAPSLQKNLARPGALFVLSRVILADRLTKLKGFEKLYQNQGYLLGGNRAAAVLWRKVGGP